VAEVFSGPLPPPTLLDQYNKIVPGSAKTIIEMAEGQSKHRQELEKWALSTDASLLEFFRSDEICWHFGRILL
jgi:uncharacterized membrane protein